jgi:hypothetical protein
MSRLTVIFSTTSVQSSETSGGSGKSNPIVGGCGAASVVITVSEINNQTTEVEKDSREEHGKCVP